MSASLKTFDLIKMRRDIRQKLSGLKDTASDLEQIEKILKRNNIHSTCLKFTVASLIDENDKSIVIHRRLLGCYEQEEISP